MRASLVVVALCFGCGNPSTPSGDGTPVSDSGLPRQPRTDAGPRVDNVSDSGVGDGGVGVPTDGGAVLVDAKDPRNFDELDVNIYWFGVGDVSERAVAGQPNRYYDPSKPTVIYMHGWAGGSAQKRYRESYDRTQWNKNADVGKAWREAGWNVGAFYWNQYSDEGEVKDAEAKIYTELGPQKMRWRDAQGNYNEGPAKSVMLQAVERMESVMSDYRGAELRLVGHSLGAQLAIHVSGELWRRNKAGKVPTNLVPKRVALMDPAFLQDGRPYLNNRWTGEIARENVSANRSEILYEAYRSSPATSNFIIGDVNQGLLEMTAFVELKPWYYPFYDVRAKHNMAPGWYFESLTSNLTVKCSGLAVPSASVPNATLRVMQDAQKHYEQIDSDGAYTYAVADDEFVDKKVACKAP